MVNADWELNKASSIYASNVERQWTWEPGCAQARPPKEHYMDTLAPAPTQATQSSASKPNGEEAESRMTNTER